MSNPFDSKFAWSRVKSFRDAGRGAWVLVGTQFNMRVHLSVASVAVVWGGWFKLNRWEWGLVVMAIAMVLVTESINTALEFTCDAITEDAHPRIRDAKDIAAAAVLLSAVAALVLGAIVFIPKII